MAKSFRIFGAMVLAIFFALFSCRRTMSREEVETQLRKAMLRGLYENIGNDSSKIKYEVLSVSFFEDKEMYDCEFMVRLKKAGYDTTGSMGAMITKDFKKMRRKY